MTESQGYLKTPPPYRTDTELLAEIERLRAALQKIADRNSEGYESYDQIAREALGANEQSSAKPEPYYTDGHAKDCAYHQDQYSWECTCGRTRKL